MICGLIEILNH